MSNQKRLLFIRLSSLGDILHSMVVLSYLKKEGYHITWMVEKRFEEVISIFKDVDEIITVNIGGDLPYRKSYLEAKEKLKKLKFDVVLDIQGLLKSGLSTFLASSKRKIGFSYSNSRELSWLFYNERVDVSNLTNILDKNLSLLSALNISVNSEDEYNISIEQRHKNKMMDYFKDKNLGEKKLLINPWAGYKTKELPTDVLFDLIDVLKIKGINPVLMYGPDNYDEAFKISRVKDVLLQPTTNFIELFALIDYFDYYVGCDSGPSFISAILKKKTLILFGPTNIDRQSPRYSNVRSIYSQYRCPIIKRSPIKTPYRCRDKKCGDPLCMKKYNGQDILKELSKFDKI